MKYYFIENFSKELVFDSEDLIVSLTPESSQAMEQRGLNYKIPEDFYSESEFLKDEPNYYHDQLSCFKQYDNILRNKFFKAKNWNIKLATSVYYVLKVVIDSLIIRSKIAHRILDSVNPDEVVYVSNMGEPDKFTDEVHSLLFLNCQSIYSRVFPIICEQKGIDFHHLILGNTNIRINKPSVQNNLTGLIKRKINHFAPFYKYYTGKSYLSSSCNKPNSNILFLQPNSFCFDLMLDFKKEGHNVFYRTNGIIKSLSVLHRTVDIEPEFLNAKNKTPVSMTDTQQIIDWINKYCKLDISSIIVPRLQHFEGELCPRILHYVDYYHSYFRLNNIDLIITKHKVCLQDHGAILASKICNNIKSICLQHGDDIFDIKSYDYREYHPYDYYFTNDTEMLSHIKSRLKKNKFDTKVFIYGYRYLSEGRIKARAKNIDISNNYVLYIPTFYQWDNTLWNEARLPDTWYHKWQQSLLQFFSEKKDKKFIWKSLNFVSGLKDPFEELIGIKNYPNVIYASNSIKKWFPKVDSVLLDYPSTALYESAACGLPVMTFYFKRFHKIRPTAMELFGKSICPFDNISNGIKQVDKYINSDLNEYKVSIPYSKTSIINTIFE
jgi:hypothetical protein